MILGYIIDAVVAYLWHSAVEWSVYQLWDLHRSARPRSWERNGKDTGRFWRGCPVPQSEFPAPKGPPRNTP